MPTVASWAVFAPLFIVILALFLAAVGAQCVDGAAWRGAILACQQCQELVSARAARVRNVALATGFTLTGAAALWLAAAFAMGS